MDLKAICSSIKKWNEIRLNEHEVKEYFNTGTSFEITISDRQSSSIHVYVGALDNELVFFSIPASRDTREQYESSEGLLPFITVSQLQIIDKTDLGNQISPEEANLRIENWMAHKEEWIHEECHNNGVYQAVEIPVEDFIQNDTYFGFLALKKVQNKYKPDLVILDEGSNKVDGSVTSFYDTARPVPPFGGGVSQTAFFILSLAVANEFHPVS